jgi:hypothetical protein
MSEYQYYEFQAVDRRLSEQEMQELRRFSSRARITPTGFVNEYSFGNFKGDEALWMERYFDAFLYLANWGTHIFMVRVPARLLPAKVARQYCPGAPASVSQKGGNLVFTFVSEEEPTGEWIEGDGILSSILPIRDELARGDLRALYLGWLLWAQDRKRAEREPEPPVPANLGELSRPLSNLAEFLRIDPDLLAVAAQSSPSTKPDPAGRKELAAWVGALPTNEKDALLVRLMEGGDAHLGTELHSRFVQERSAQTSVAKSRRRTAGELLAAAKAWEQERRQEEARAAAEAKARREREAAIAREKHLDALVGRVPELWASVEGLIATRQPKSYDAAVRHLVDLRDLAKRGGTTAEFVRRIAALREAHVRKQAFVTRLGPAGL